MTRAPPQSFEPTLLNIENRIAVLKQTKQYRPGDPMWVLFSDQEIEQMFGRGKPEEASCP